MIGNVIQPNGASGGGGFNPTLIKTITIAKSDYGEETSGYREATKSVNDILNILMSKNVLVLAYDTNSGNYYHKALMAECISHPSLFSARAFVVFMQGEFTNKYEAEAYYRRMVLSIEQAANHNNLIVQIWGGHYNALGTNENLVVEFYTLN